MPSSSNFSVVAALGTAADCDRGIPAIDPTLLVVAAAPMQGMYSSYYL
jgi:hypothetical protein